MPRGTKETGRRPPPLLFLLLLHPLRCTRQQLLVGLRGPKASLQQRRMAAVAPLLWAAEISTRLTRTRKEIFW